MTDTTHDSQGTSTTTTTTTKSAGTTTTAKPTAAHGYARGVIHAVDPASVSLLRWLRRQLRQATPLREHLEAAVAHDDPAEARRLVAQIPFSPAQRLLDAWEASDHGE